MGLLAALAAGVAAGLAEEASRAAQTHRRGARAVEPAALRFSLRAAGVEDVEPF